ncbi:caspase family protein [Desulfococcaceae bacterium HSG9]|nr:caspase family protein [Desulfococcaceae bacterium HSG9]
MLKIRPILIYAFILIAFATNAQSAEKHALLIGINDYRGTNLDPLQGCVNDVELIKEILHNKYEFKDERITVLKNADAKHTDIEKAIRNLCARIRPGDAVYIHYSGHGSFRSDLNNEDEREKQDQTWVSYGARSGRFAGIDNHDILDDELNEWLQPVFAKTQQAIFVSDSCHSASVTRGDVVMRGGPPDEKAHPLAIRKSKSAKFKTGVRIGAARDDEKAGEADFQNGKRHGLFTYYWAKALEQACPGAAWSDLFKKVSAQVNCRNSKQRPQMQGMGELTVFSGDFKPTPNKILVSEVVGTEAQIDAGFLSDVTIGSIYKLYDPQNLTRSNLPSIKITEVHPFHSTGQISGTIRPDSLVTEAFHNYKLQPIPVFLNADFPQGADEKLLEKLRVLINSDNLPEFELTTAQNGCQIVLYILRPQKQNGAYLKKDAHDSLPRSFEKQPPQLWLSDKFEQPLGQADGIPLGDSDDGFDVVKKTLKNIARVREIKQLASDRVANVKLSAVVWEPADMCLKNSPDCLKFDDGRMFKKQGEYSAAEIAKAPLKFNNVLTFKLKNRSADDYYAYLLDIMDNGDINPIYPGTYDRMADAEIKKGETRDYRFAPLVLNVEGNETVKLLVTAKPIDITLLLSSRSTALIDMNKLNPLERLLIKAAHGKRGGPELINMDWGAWQHSFAIRK